MSDDECSPPASPRPSVDPPLLVTLRSRLEELVNGDQMEKHTALEITRLFHLFETHMLSEFKKKDEENVAILNKLEQERLQHELDRLVRRQTVEEVSRKRK